MASATAAKAVQTLLQTKVAALPAWAVQTFTKKAATTASTEFLASYKVRVFPFTPPHTHTHIHFHPLSPSLLTSHAFTRSLGDQVLSESAGCIPIRRSLSV